ncbi:MAG: hypothetical protein Q7R47_00315, partial [Candidatus Diapherotrites archaeon]|nr:hypothetical protein [Candidatus Diapherotrites archaeon]
QQSNDQAKNAQQQGQMASQAASLAACAASDQLNRFADASSQLSDDLAGDKKEVQQNIAVLLAAGVSTGYLDGIYTPDQLVTNILTGFTINLRNDARDVVVDSPKVTGRFETDSARVNGEFVDQQAGVVFENRSLGEETAFAVVTLDSNWHDYADPAVVPAGFADWGPYRLEGIGETRVFSQKYHVKFVGAQPPQAQTTPTDAAQLCQSGALIGKTGADALPRIKLAWNWTDITSDTCDAKNPDYAYCDATQFSIMMSKRVQALREFLGQNQALKCPANEFEQNLSAEMDRFNANTTGDQFVASDTISGCWLPKTTDVYDKKAALEYFVAATPDVSWTREVPNAAALHDLLFFDAYLIQDGYPPDFLTDFSRYYTNESLLDTPLYFFNDGSGRNLNEFFDNQKIRFSERFSQAQVLSASGKYHIETIIDFSSDAWDFFDADKKTAADITVSLQAADATLLESPFYFMPFDGRIGNTGNLLDRSGYGAVFKVGAADVLRVSRQDEVPTLNAASVGALSQIDVSRRSSFSELNTLPTRRGMILDVFHQSDTVKSMVFSPSVATPLVMHVKQS